MVSRAVSGVRILGVSVPSRVPRPAAGMTAQILHANRLNRLRRPRRTRQLGSVKPEKVRYSTGSSATSTPWRINCRTSASGASPLIGGRFDSALPPEDAQSR